MFIKSAGREKLYDEKKSPVMHRERTAPRTTFGDLMKNEFHSKPTPSSC